jgi:hypothetical protein
MNFDDAQEIENGIGHLVQLGLHFWQSGLNSLPNLEH